MKRRPPCLPGHPERQAGPESGIIRATYWVYRKLQGLKAPRSAMTPGQTVKVSRIQAALSFRKAEVIGIPDLVKKPRMLVPRGQVSPATLPITLHSVPSCQSRHRRRHRFTSGPGSAPPPTRHRNALWAAVSVGRHSPDRKRLGDSRRPDGSRWDRSQTGGGSGG